MPISIDRLKGASLEKKGLVYLSLAQAIIREIESGKLAAGERLPTHRELSESLGLSLGTVTRALGVVSQQGLIEARPRRGTFVVGLGTRRAGDTGGKPKNYQRFVDLGTNTHVPAQFTERLAETFSALAADKKTLHEVDHYLPTGGLLRHRQAAAAWLSDEEFPVAPEQVLICDGTQNALAAVLLAFSHPGDTVLTEELTYPGMHLLARVLGLELVGLPVDQDGLTVDGLRHALSGSTAKFLFCTPTLQTPTCSIMPPERRWAIADIAKESGVLIIEDAVYADIMPDRPAPIAAWSRQQSVLITSLSKTVAQGLRVGFMVSDQRHMPDLRRSLQSIAFTGPNLMAEIACRWFVDGTAAGLIRDHRNIIRSREAIARECFVGFDYVSHPFSSHSWLRLGARWDPSSFNTRCNSEGIGLRPSNDFAVTAGSGPQGVRITLGAADTDSELRSCLSRVVDILDREHSHQALRA